MDSEDSTTAPAEARRTAWTWVAFALYLPVAGALGALVLFCFFLLVKGQRAGLYGLLYAGILYALGRRMAAIFYGRVEGSLWKDIVLMSVADLLLAVLALSQLPDL
ncbi:MAG: hypothetical protein HY927_13780 [Elusimicrobia bacterium]|nr:hypothetical protein [Elusimicrobiota bacterium]